MLKAKCGILLVGFATAFQACNNDAGVATREDTESNVGVTKAEEAFPGQIGIPKEGYLEGNKITYQDINGNLVLDGDILLQPDEVDAELVLNKTSGAGRSDYHAQWLGQRVPYAIAANLTNPSRVIDAIADWQAKTHFVFKQRTAESDYISFEDGGGCSSYVGRQGGKQVVTLNVGCSTGSTIHEIGHAIGLYHEQSRSNRDAFLTVNWGNIQAGKASNFNTYSQSGLDGKDYTAMDFGSIMLYSSYDFSANGLPTLVKKDGSTFTAQRTALSPLDAIAASSMYIWTLLPGKANDIGTSAGGAFMISNYPVNGGGYVYKWDESNRVWKIFTGAGIRVDVDPNGSPWIVNSSKVIFQWNGAWVNQSRGIGAYDIGIGAEGSIFIISDKAYGGGNYYVYKWNGSGWTSFTGAGTRITVDQSGKPWVVNASGAILQWSGSAWINRSNGMLAVDVGAGPGGVVLITSADASRKIYQWWNDSVWIEYYGGANSIDVDGTGNAWGVTSQNDIWRHY